MGRLLLLLFWRKLIRGARLYGSAVTSARKIAWAFEVSASVSIRPSIRSATTVATPAAMLNRAKAVRCRSRIMFRKAKETANLRHLNTADYLNRLPHTHEQS